jgi:hypothetical protein
VIAAGVLSRSNEGAVPGRVVGMPRALSFASASCLGPGFFLVTARK